MSWERKMQGYIDNLQSLNDTVQGSKEWLEARRCRLTASNFRAIAKMCAAISPKNTIKSFFYNPLKGNVPTAYGQEQERPTEAEFVDGFVSRGACEISVAHTGLGGVERERALVASPDGIVCCHPGSSDYPIVEYKTAKMLVDQQITVDDAIGGIKDFPVTFGKDRRSYELKRSHNFSDQVQGVMAATCDKYPTCIFHHQGSQEVNGCGMECIWCGFLSVCFETLSLLNNMKNCSWTGPSPNEYILPQAILCGVEVWWHPLNYDLSVINHTKINCVW